MGGKGDGQRVRATAGSLRTRRTVYSAPEWEAAEGVPWGDDGKLNGTPWGTL